MMDLKTIVTRRYMVSTVEMPNLEGLDFGYTFETMVFSMLEGSLDYAEEECVRYSTEEEARAGHERMVKKWDTA